MDDHTTNSMENNKLPLGLRKPWVWVQPLNPMDLVSRLEEAADLNVHERERENLCSCAAATIRSFVGEQVDINDQENVVLRTALEKIGKGPYDTEEFGGPRFAQIARDALSKLEMEV